MSMEDRLIALIESNVSSRSALTEDEFRVAWWRGLEAQPSVPSHRFVSQRVFRRTVVYAESLGMDPAVYLGAGPLIVHPDSVAWYLERLALGRMREHFGMLS